MYVYVNDSTCLKATYKAGKRLIHIIKLFIQIKKWRKNKNYAND